VQQFDFAAQTLGNVGIVKQLDECTDLSSRYTLAKKNRAFKNMVFTGKPAAARFGGDGPTTTKGRASGR